MPTQREKRGSRMDGVMISQTEVQLFIKHFRTGLKLNLKKGTTGRITNKHRLNVGFEQC